MDRCDVVGCYEVSRFLIAASASHFKVCGGCIAYEMQRQGVVCATIIDLKKVTK
jgi:hypothetical protein